MSSGFGGRRTLPMEDGEDAPRADLLPCHPRSDRRSDSSASLDHLVALPSHAPPGHVVVDVRTTANAEGNEEDDGGGGTLDFVGGTAVRFVLAFHDLTYNVGRPRRVVFRRRSTHVETDATTTRGGGARARALLDGVSGEAREGEIMAVLGASGAGKTTLIDALADRIRRDSLRGAVTLNGEALGGRLLKVISAYVMQDDLLYPMLTVAETLMYSAEFRLPRSLSTSKKASRVQALIDQLGLRAAANTIIGDEGRRGVSGGERRRVSIGIDIIHDPIILFLDEPTSGLDSTSAFMVVKVLQGIAQSGSVVIMSIHQPSYRIIGLLDRLLFLSRGRTVYYGPPAGLPLFFSDFGHPIPDGQNPAEFALDHVRQLESSPKGADELVEFSNSWQKKPVARAVSAAARTGHHDKPSLPLKEAIRMSIARGKLVSGTSDSGTAAASTAEVATYANPWWVEVWVLARRAFTNTRRTPELFLIRLGTVVVTAFILATVFWRLDSTPKGVNERFGFFAIAISTMFYTSADALPVFLIERYIYLRETAHNAYRRSSYVLSNAIVSFPPLVVLSLAFALITFFAVGLAGGAGGFLFFVLIVLASFWAGSGFVTFLSGVVRHVIIGYTVVVGLLAYFLLLSGFFVTRDRIPSYWTWLHYLSLIKYPYEAVMQNEFGGEPGRCFMRGVQMFDGTPIGALPAETKVSVLNAMSRSMGVDFNSSSCITTGPDILARQAVAELGKWSCLWVTVAWGFLFRALFYLTLVVGSRNRRR
ncbi:ABC transporter G family member 5-like [Oryza brachyantha]|uniref:ABC transporter G family member 5-like n=1 Tax=Oryza brachyantha TaxID=4533 RepID=UPI001ADA50D1|nr:ABC transporter G family member 5-like [Oryza brachyantha]